MPKGVWLRYQESVAVERRNGERESRYEGANQVLGLLLGGRCRLSLRSLRMRTISAGERIAGWLSYTARVGCTNPKTRTTGQAAVYSVPSRIGPARS